MVYFRHYFIFHVKNTIIYSFDEIHMVTRPIICAQRVVTLTVAIASAAAIITHSPLKTIQFILNFLSLAEILLSSRKKSNYQMHENNFAPGKLNLSELN